MRRSRCVKVRTEIVDGDGQSGDFVQEWNAFEIGHVDAVLAVVDHGANLVGLRGIELWGASDVRLDLLWEFADVGQTVGERRGFRVGLVEAENDGRVRFEVEWTGHGACDCGAQDEWMWDDVEDHFGAHEKLLFVDHQNGSWMDQTLLAVLEDVGDGEVLRVGLQGLVWHEK